MQKSLFSVFSVSLICILFASCAEQPVAVPMKTSHMAVLSELYVQYQSQNMGQAPPDEAAFKAFAAADQAQLDDLGLGSVDELFTSARDGMPVVLYFGDRLPTLEGRSVIGHEQNGTEGSRVVAYEMASFELVDDGRFGQLQKN